MLKIRLRRMGAKKAPFYRFVVSNGRYVPTGPFVDSIGHYDPRTEPVTLKIDLAKADVWMAKGAQPSDTVKSLIEKARNQSA